jgi:hypothetical protein
MLLHVLLNQLIRSGTLKVTDAGGRVMIFGDGKSPCSALRFHSHAVAWKLPFNPSLYFAEGYMDGVITIEEGGLDEITRDHSEKLRAPGGALAVPFARSRVSPDPLVGSVQFD